VDQKYYFAGCSARWMFGKTVSNVVQIIDKYFERAPNFVDLFKGNVGLESADMANHLACKQGSSGKRFFTSRYIAREAICKGGNEVVRLAYSVADGLQNDSFTGWIVEMDFIEQIKRAKGDGLGVKLNGGQLTFEVSGFVHCDTNSWDSIKQAVMKEPTAENLNNLWLFPTKWYQAGYDLVCLRSRGDLKVLRFIQVTAAKVHGLKLQHFRALASTFVEGLGLEIHGIEIFMAIPSDLANFKISKVEGEICAWFVGESTQEKWELRNSQSQVSIVKFDRTG